MDVKSKLLVGEKQNFSSVTFKGMRRTSGLGSGGGQPPPTPLVTEMGVDMPGRHPCGC